MVYTFRINDIEVYMSFNAVIVPGRDPINGQLMVDPLGQQSPLPIEVARIIFQNLKADLPSVALVCKNWNALADNEIFRQMIRPAQAFGIKEWQEHIGVDAGTEPPLRRCAYGNLEREGGMLTFIPDKVKVVKDNRETEEVLLDSLRAIGNLIKKPRTDLETGFDDLEVDDLIIGMKRIAEKPHWIWIKKEILGRNKTYAEQQELAKVSRVNIPGLMDIAISVFMEYVRSGERNFICYRDKYKWDGVRVKDKMFDTEWGIALSFCDISGLDVYNVYDDSNYDNIGFAASRKSD